MLKEKESFWKKKGFYTSVCVMLVGVMAVGAITYRKLNAPQNGDNKLLANIATEVPAATKAPGVDKKKQEAAPVNAPVSRSHRVRQRKQRLIRGKQLRKYRKKVQIHSPKKILDRLQLRQTAQSTHSMKKQVCSGRSKGM